MLSSASVLRFATLFEPWLQQHVNASRDRLSVGTNLVVVAAWCGLAYFGSSALGQMIIAHGGVVCGASGILTAIVCEAHWLTMCIAMMVPMDKRVFLRLQRCYRGSRAYVASLFGYAALWALVGALLHVFDASAPSIGNFFRFMPFSTIATTNAIVVGLWMLRSLAKTPERAARSKSPLLTGIGIARQSIERCWPIMLLCYYQESIILMACLTFAAIVMERLENQIVRLKRTAPQPLTCPKGVVAACDRSWRRAPMTKRNYCYRLSGQE